jgi:hypothetical protein
MIGNKLTIALCVLFACGTVVGQSRQPVIVDVDSSTVIPARADSEAAGAPIIFSNLGSNTALYQAGIGWGIAGPNNTVLPYQQSVAIPFTPAKSAHVTLIKAAIGTLSGSGVNSFDLGLYNDNGSGMVGTAIGTVTITNAKRSGLCCNVTVTASFSGSGLPVTARTRYWVAATPNSTGLDFAGTWDFSVDALAAFDTNQAGWGPVAYGGPAVQVRGTIP